MIVPDLYTINMFLHLLGVSIWLGLTLNFSLFVVPILRDIPREKAKEQFQSIGRRARYTVIGLMILLLVTGTVNLYRVNLLNLSPAWGSQYGITAGIKISLALLLFTAFPVIFILTHRVGNDDVDSRITQMNYLHWGITTVTLIIIFFGVLLRG